MCDKTGAKAARECLEDAIDRFEQCTALIRPAPPPLNASTKALDAIAEIYRGAAVTVPLVRRKA